MRQAAAEGPHTLQLVPEPGRKVPSVPLLAGRRAGAPAASAGWPRPVGRPVSGPGRARARPLLAVWPERVPAVVLCRGLHVLRTVRGLTRVRLSSVPVPVPALEYKEAGQRGDGDSCP